MASSAFSPFSALCQVELEVCVCTGLLYGGKVGEVLILWLFGYILAIQVESHFAKFNAHQSFQVHVCMWYNIMVYCRLYMHDLTHPHV